LVGKWELEHVGVVLVVEFVEWERFEFEFIFVFILLAGPKELVQATPRIE